MELETVDHLLTWTQDFHRNLQRCLKHCAGAQQSERVRLLTDYLIDHEKELTRLVGQFQQQADKNVLDTWCLEYVNKERVKAHDICDLPYADMNAQEVVNDVIAQHEKVIDLYRYLVNKAETPEVRELLEELLDLEQHEAMRMVQSSNRWGDM